MMVLVLQVFLVLFAFFCARIVFPIVSGGAPYIAAAFLLMGEVVYIGLP